MNEMKFFYETIYTPYIKNRYKFSFILDFEQFKLDLLKNPWELLLIKKNGLVVGGACNILINERYRMRINALTDEMYLKEGAMTAIYYYTILRAKEKNAKILDFGLSRPFLSDGVLINKSKWGAKIVKSDTHRVMYLKNLKKEGLIIFEDKKLKAIIFSEQNAKIRPYSDSGLEFKILESGI
jgi:lipid II:glycine glycyltransferase (peptidoglycan interpeptide bridge formation enzyme)